MLPTFAETFDEDRHTRRIVAAALEWYEAGGCVIRTNTEKQPTVSFGSWTVRPGPNIIKKWFDRAGPSNLALVAGSSGVAVVDVDDKGLHDVVEQHFGTSPIIAKTFRGTHHYYRAIGGERSANLRNAFGLPIDIKAGNAIVVVPPSVNRQSGFEYTYLEGGPEDLSRLPVMLDWRASLAKEEA